MVDLPGEAIFDYHFKSHGGKLFVHDQFGPKVEMPVKLYFRNFQAMPMLEKKAIAACRGNILDIGSGAGSHALALQQEGLPVTALEISPNACEVMQDRGVQNIVCEDIFKYSGRKYDTLLLLMNGIGLCANLSGLNDFLQLSETLLEPGGSLIFDSCDISYMYEEQVPAERYFGEVRCRYEYRDRFTDWFQWLYVDQNTLARYATANGWTVKIISLDSSGQYLAKLTRSEKS